jgi:hypothetical protein
MYKKTWLLLTTLLIIFLTGPGVRAIGKNYVYHSTTGEVAVSLKGKILVWEDEIIDTILSDSGEETETVKVKVTLNNWMSKFWSNYYWFRKADGVFLRSEGVNGPPGTPVTVMTMVSEELLR